MNQENYLVVPPGGGYSSLIKGDISFNGAVRPQFSFSYDSLQFSMSAKFYRFANVEYQMTPEQIEEVNAYIESVEPDPSITAKIVTNNQARRYLASTDWYVIRLLETGVPVPEDISQMREEARQKVEHI